MQPAIFNNKSQKEKFEEAAREVGADDSSEAFDARLKRIATAHPKDQKPDDAKVS